MPIDSISTNPVSPVPIKGTGSVERSPVVPETSSITPMPSVIATSANPVEKAPAETSKELAEAMEAVEIMMNVRNRSIQFVKDESSGANVIKVIDDNTGEVIRQLPSEELLGFMRNLTKMLGNFLDERV
jgi:flagellar protein FlaG